MWYWWALYALIGLIASISVYYYALKPEEHENVVLTRTDRIFGTIVYGIVWPILLLIVCAAAIRCKIKQLSS